VGSHTNLIKINFKIYRSEMLVLDWIMQFWNSVRFSSWWQYAFCIQCVVFSLCFRGVSQS